MSPEGKLLQFLFLVGRNYRWCKQRNRSLQLRQLSFSMCLVGMGIVSRIWCPRDRNSLQGKPSQHGRLPGNNFLLCRSCKN